MGKDMKELYQELNIRSVEINEIKKTAEIQVDGWRSAYKGIIDDDFLDSMDVEKIAERRINDYKNTGYIVAELNGEIVGFCRYIDSNTYTPDVSGIDCEIIALYVKPEMKRMGIGRAMIKFVMDEFKAKDKIGMVLWCLKDNVPSKKFYEAMGGKIIGEHNVTFGGKEYEEVGFKFLLN